MAFMTEVRHTEISPRKVNPRGTLPPLSKSAPTTPRAPIDHRLKANKMLKAKAATLAEETERYTAASLAARQKADSHEEDLEVWKCVANLHETTLKSARRILMTGMPMNTVTWRENKRAEEEAVAKEVIQESARVSRRREEIMKRKMDLTRAQHEAHFKELEAEIARQHEKKRLEGCAATSAASFAPPWPRACRGRAARLAAVPALHMVASAS